MNDWLSIQIKELGNIVTGNTPPRANPEYYGAHTLFVKPTDIDYDIKYTYETEEDYSELGFEKYRNSLIPKGATCVVTIGSIGRKITKAHCNLFINQAMNAVIPSAKYDEDFVYYLLKFNVVKLKTLDSGTASGRENVSKSSFSNMRVSVPPLPIQKQIGKVLSNYDDLIENNFKRIKLLEESARLTYEEWFLRFRIDGKKLEINSETSLPFGWEEKTIKDFGHVITGKTPSTTNHDYYNGNVPFVKTPNMHKYPYVIETTDYLTDEGANTQSNKFLKKNSLMVSCIGSAGVYSLVSKDCQTNQQINSIKFFKENYTFYMYGFAQSFEIILDALGSNGATMTNVNKTKFENIKVIMPDILYLDKYHEIVEPKFEVILNLLEQNQLLKEARDILLPRLMTGMIDVEDMKVAV